MQIDVSIIIPTYNRLWCLPRAVSSCRGARCRTEIIVVDDGSTDDSWAWLQQQPDVVAIRQENQGQTWAVNRGTASARGKYIRFLDSDDAIGTGTIDRQFEEAERSGAELVYSRVDDLHQATGEIVRHEDPPLWDDFLAVQLGEGYGSHFLGMQFHRRLVERVPRRPEFAMREDRMFLLEVGLLNPTLATVPGCGGHWTKHDQQMHDTYRGTKVIVANWQHVTIYRRILGELARRGELTPRRARAAASVIWRLAHEVARWSLSEGRELADWARELDPAIRPQGPRMLARMYDVLGFSLTERVLGLRRSLLTPFREATS